MLSLWRSLVWPEWRYRPGRHAIALLAVALGVALAFSVHLINRSALAEFGAAVRSVNGQPDLSLHGPREGFDEALLRAVAAAPGVTLASPVVEIDTYAYAADGSRVALRVLGLDALVAPALAPELRPRPAEWTSKVASKSTGTGGRRRPVSHRRRHR